MRFRNYFFQGVLRTAGETRSTIECKKRPWHIKKFSLSPKKGIMECDRARSKQSSSSSGFIEGGKYFLQYVNFAIKIAITAQFQLHLIAL